MKRWFFLDAILSAAVCAIIMLTENGAAATPWVVRTGLTEAPMEADHAKWIASPYNLQPVCINGYEQGGTARFSALYVKPADEVQAFAVIGVTGSIFTAVNAARQSQGWRLVWLNGFGVGSEARFNAVWRKTNGAAQQVRLGQTLAQHQAEVSALNAEGFRLSGISSYTVTGSAVHSAWWTESQFVVETDVIYSQTPAQYQAEFNAHGASQGWRLTSVSGYTVAGGERFTAIFRKLGGPAWWAMHGLDATNFDSADQNAHYTGFRPAFLHTYPLADAPRHNAVFQHDHGLAPARSSAISGAIYDYMDTYDRPGLSLAITREGRLVYAAGFGFADLSTGEIVGPRHRFRIASVSKPVCAVATLHALERFPGTLDSDVFGSGALLANDFGTPPYSVREQAITVRNLLNMTSGWVSDGMLWYHSEPSWGSGHEELMDYQLDDVEPSFSAGTAARYTNINYVTAARVVEKLSGQTFETYVKNEILAPCGVIDMDVGNRRKAERQFREVVYYPDTEDAGAYLIDPRRMDGSTAWIARPMELLLLARRMDDDPTYDDILNQASMDAMRTPSAAPQWNGDAGMNPDTYGLGWAGTNNTSWSHNGSMEGSTANLVTRADGISWAYASNGQEGGDKFSNQISNLVNDFIDTLNAANAWPEDGYDLYTRANTAYDAWWTATFSAVDRGQPGLQQAVWGQAADPDDDGVTNAGEAYLGRDPLVWERSPFSIFEDGGIVTVRWLRWQLDRGVRPRVRTSTEMRNWITPIGLTITPRPDLITRVGYEFEEVQMQATAEKRFFRLEFVTD